MSLPIGGAVIYGTANFHDHKLLFETKLIQPISMNIDGLKVCANNTNGPLSSCLTDSECCEAPYSPSGFGCQGPSGTSCCLVGAALSPDLINPALPNCLVMGDSVSIGYVNPVVDTLREVCNVQHSPWDVSNGGWGSSESALECLDLMLKTANQEEVNWDVIFFNNGLHDLENTTEAVAAYSANLDAIAKFLKPKAKTVLYGMTTPLMNFYREGNFIIESHNEAAARIMADNDIATFPLYDRVVEKCGPVPYVDCEICAASPCDFHYLSAGSEWIASVISEAINTTLFN